ncbi:M1 family metallopeptidase [Streptomyces violaceusniger]|uniref:M1 family metallopeptidase n=1 Tax=Streptomyces violaceusniger TaxID=68280 RepID=UPI003685FB6F
MARHTRHSNLTPWIVTALATALTGVAGCTPDATSAQSGTRTAPTPGAAGIGDTLHPGLGNGGYTVRHTDLALRFAEDLKTYTATTTLRGRATHALSRFDLDLTGTTVRSVTVDGREATWTRTGQELRVTPADPVPDGRGFSVEVTVHAPVAGPEEAQKLGTSAIGMVRAKGVVQTINQPSGAHRIAAFADHPAQKAPTTITIAAPSRVNAIANGELTATRREGAYTVRRFESRHKLAPELIQIGVGHFTVVKRRGPDGIKLRHALPTGQVNDLMPQLDTVVPKALRFLTRRLGPFPLRTYGIYATPLGGELETQSLTLLATEELTKEGMEANGSDTIVAHEISHEYFGNSVSPRRWSDLWLNEGHAVYYQGLWSQEAHGTDPADAMKSAYRDATAQLRKQGPVADPRLGAFMPKDMAPYGWGAYEGGALVLYALRQKVGEATFQRIERAWVAEHRDSTAGTADFIRLASRVAGRDLGPFLRSWLYSTKLPAMPGHPDWHTS